MHFDRTRFMAKGALMGLCATLLLTACGGGGNSGGGGSTPTPTPTPTPSTANEWTWMSGSSTAGAKGVYGTLGVPSSSNVPGSQTGAVGWADKSGNLWLFGEDALWEFTPSTMEWTWESGSQTAGPAVYGKQGVAASTNSPGSRSGAVGWADSAGDLWLFGGDAFDDLWEFTPTNNQWTWMSGSNSTGASIFGALGVASASNTPGARSDSVSWTDAAGNFWLFGGNGVDSTGTGGLLNDLWEFSPTAKTWTWVSGSDKANAAGIYGTQGVASTSNAPGGRWGSVSWIDNSGNLWLFGGSSPVFESSLNDLWEFNPTAKTWTWVSGSSTAGVVVGVYGTQGVPAANNAPGSRCLAVSWIDSSGNLWLFGGQGYGSNGTVNGDLNDLWEYSPAAREWKWVDGSSTGTQDGPSGVYGTLGVPAATNIPGGRDSAVSWTDSNGNFWLFGGESTESFNDLWRFAP